MPKTNLNPWLIAGLGAVGGLLVGNVVYSMYVRHHRKNLLKSFASSVGETVGEVGDIVAGTARGLGKSIGTVAGVVGQTGKSASEFTGELVGSGAAFIGQTAKATSEFAGGLVGSAVEGLTDAVADTGLPVKPVYDTESVTPAKLKATAIDMTKPSLVTDVNPVLNFQQTPALRNVVRPCDHSIEGTGIQFAASNASTFPLSNAGTFKKAAAAGCGVGCTKRILNSPIDGHSPNVIPCAAYSGKCPDDCYENLLNKPDRADLYTNPQFW